MKTEINWKNNEYKLYLPDDADESYAGGIWDLSEDFMNMYKNSDIDTFQTELYGLLKAFCEKQER